MPTVGAIGRVLRLAVLTLGKPRTVLVKLRHEPLWPFLGVLAQYRLAKADVDPVGMVVHLFPEASAQDVNNCYLQIREKSALYSHLRGAEQEGARRPRHTIVSGMAESEGEVLYSVLRLLKPSVVVETGVAAGMSSTFLLEALADNRRGELWSIDLPTVGRVDDGLEYWRPASAEPGWMIPSPLRDRWHLILGSSRDKLLPLLQRLGEIDLFLHDSEHTLRNMEFEYRTVWPFLRPGGCLLSHDVGAPYLSLCSDVGAAPIRHTKLGGIRKVGR